MNMEPSLICRCVEKIREMKSRLSHRGGTAVESLADLPTANCSVVGLGSFDVSWLADTFSQQRIHAEWAEDAQRITALNMPEMTGGVNPGDRRALYYLVRVIKPLTLLEIGTYIGSSTVALAFAAARNQAEGIDTRIVTVDICDVNDERTCPWLEAGSPASPRSMVESVGLSYLTRFEVNTSIEKLSERGDSFEMIFLDGDHSAEAVYREIPLALNRLPATGSGIIVLHDFFPDVKPLWTGQDPLPGPYLAVKRYQREGAGFHAVPLATLPWPTKLGSCVTSLAVLSK